MSMRPTISPATSRARCSPRWSGARGGGKFAVYGSRVTVPLQFALNCRLHAGGSTWTRRLGTRLVQDLSASSRVGSRGREDPRLLLFFGVRRDGDVRRLDALRYLPHVVLRRHHSCSHAGLL